MTDPNILRGADFAAAARTLGLSVDEAIDLVSRKQRQLAKRDGRNLTPEQLAQALIKRAGQVDAINEELPANIDEYRTVPNTVLEYGEQGNQDELQNFQGDDERDRVREKRDPNVFRKTEKVKKRGKTEYRQRQIVLGENEPLRDEQLRAQEMLRDFGLRVQREQDEKGGYIRRNGKRLYREAGQEVGSPRLIRRPEVVVPIKDVMAPGAQILGERLGAIEDLADAPGFNDSPEVASLLGSIEDQIRPDSGAEAALARDLVRRDREGMREEELVRRAKAQVAREVNMDIAGTGPAPVAAPDGIAGKAVLVGDGEPVKYRLHPAAGLTPGMAGATSPVGPDRAAREAEIIDGLRRIRFNSQAAEENIIGAQAEARRLFKEGYPDAGIRAIGNVQKIGFWKNADDFAVNRDARIFEGNRFLPVPEVNERLVGPLQRHERFLVDYVPGYREGGAFNDYPQVGINEQISAAREAIGKAKFGGQAVDVADVRIRNLRDLQNAADMVIALGQEKGKKFFKREDGANVLVTNPGINEVLQRGGMNARQVGDVARAFFAIEAAKRNPINEDAKRAYYTGKAVAPTRPVEFGGDHPQLGGGGAKVARLAGEKVKGKEVKGQLQALTGRAGNPGEPLNAAELKQARMPFIGAVEGEPRKRARFVKGEDRNLSEAALIEKYGPVNGQIANAVISGWNEQQRGANTDGFGMGGDDSIQREIAQRSGDQAFQIRPDVHIKNNLNMLENPEAIERGKARARAEIANNKNPALRQVVKERGKFRLGKPAGKAPVRDIQLPPQAAPASAPDEIYVGGGDGYEMRPSAAGAGDGGNKPPTAVAAPAPGGEQPQQPAPQQGPVMSPKGYDRTFGERAAFIGNKIKGYATSPRFQRGRRVAYASAGTGAGLVGLDALIGGERERREEEAIR